KNLNSDSRDVGIAGDIGQRLLDQTVGASLDLAGKALFKATLLKVDLYASLLRVALELPVQRGQQPQAIEHCWAQSERELPHPFEGVADCDAHLVKVGHMLSCDLLRVVQRVPARTICVSELRIEQLKHHIDTGERLTNLVMQLASYAPSLCLLDLQHALRE